MWKQRASVRDLSMQQPAALWRMLTCARVGDVITPSCLQTIHKPWNFILMTISILVMLGVVYIDYANFRHAWNNGMASDRTSSARDGGGG